MPVRIQRDPVFDRCRVIVGPGRRGRQACGESQADDADQQRQRNRPAKQRRFEHAYHLYSAI